MTIKVEEYTIPQINPFGTAYIQDYNSVSSFFHYSPYQADAYTSRAEELSDRHFERKALSQVLRNYHQRLKISPQVEENLKKLEDPHSVVVIGGQQAGLLLGPLYTIHKAITILTLASQKEIELGVPVIPIFWIAGEDHDLQEVNHVYQPKAETFRMEKWILQDSVSSQKISISQRLLPQVEIEEWIQAFFEGQPETEFSIELKQFIFHCASEASTYVDFFAQLLNHLFSKYGLLMIDSGNQELRRLESKVFEQVINNYDLIDKKVRLATEEMRRHNFSPQIQMGKYPALLFIYEEGERLLLEKIGDSFQTKDGHFVYEKHELLTIAQEEPWRLSNNVVTRPFMQENLFPTLAFVGGPGEIAYWALYQTYFEEFGMKMPILVPRMSMTLVEKPVSIIIEKREIPLEAIFTDFQAYRSNWLQEQDQLGLEESFSEIREKIKEMYHPLMEKIISLQPGLESLAEQNLGKIIDQVDFFEKRSTSALVSKFDATLRQFDKVEQGLYPQGKMQERVYNSFTFFNKHGMVLVDKLMECPLSVNGKHKLIYI
jgi:bacillithiol biosynthesis cysteine-adding enzyme BshC